MYSCFSIFEFGIANFDTCGPILKLFYISLQICIKVHCGKDVSKEQKFNTIHSIFCNVLEFKLNQYGNDVYSLEPRHNLNCKKFKYLLNKGSVDNGHGEIFVQFACM